jgi:hypothetical protein
MENLQINSDTKTLATCLLFGDLYRDCRTAYTHGSHSTRRFEKNLLPLIPSRLIETSYSEQSLDFLFEELQTRFTVENFKYIGTPNVPNLVTGIGVVVIAAQKPSDIAKFFDPQLQIFSYNRAVQTPRQGYEQCLSQMRLSLQDRDHLSPSQFKEHLSTYIIRSGNEDAKRGPDFIECPVSYSGKTGESDFFK